MSNEKERPDVQVEFVFTEDQMEPRKRVVLNNPSKFKLVNRAQSEAFANKMFKLSDRLKDTRGNFVIGKNENIKSLETTGLTVADRRYFMQLVLYAQFNNEPLKKNGKVLNNGEIAEIWRMHYVAATRKLNKFVAKGLLIPQKSGRETNYILNELHFRMGKGVKPGEKFVKIFQKKLAEVIDNLEKIQQITDKVNHASAKRKNNLDITDVVGLLHAVIPYFHYQTYYLVKNPDDNILRGNEKVLDSLERDATQLKHLSKAEIGRVLGYKNANVQTIDRYMDHLQTAGAVMVLKSNRKTRYLIHPDLMFRLDSNGLDPYTRYVRAQFNQHR